MLCGGSVLGNEAAEVIFFCQLWLVWCVVVTSLSDSGLRVWTLESWASLESATMSQELEATSCVRSDKHFLRPRGQAEFQCPELLHLVALFPWALEAPDTRVKAVGCESGGDWEQEAKTLHLANWCESRGMPGTRSSHRSWKVMVHFALSQKSLQAPKRTSAAWSSM